MVLMHEQEYLPRRRNYHISQYTTFDIFLITGCTPGNEYRGGILYSDDVRIEETGPYECSPARLVIIGDTV